MILLQAGHYNRTTGATGAPGEKDFNWDVANKVADELRAYGKEVRVVRADPTDEQISGDHELFLAIHYDADIYGTGGYLVDFCDPEVDGATQESQRISRALSEVYGQETGIVSHPERSNINTRKYYMWNKLSEKTPCVLIECGVGQHKPDDYEVLFNKRYLVIKGIVKGLCKAFNITYKEDDMTDEQKRIFQFLVEQNAGEGKVREAFGALADIPKLNKEISNLRSQISDLGNRVADLEHKLALSEKLGSDWQSQLKTANKTNQSLVADLEYYRPYKSLYEKALKETIDKYTGWQLIRLGISKLKIKK